MPILELTGPAGAIAGLPPLFVIELQGWQRRADFVHLVPSTARLCPPTRSHPPTSFLNPGAARRIIAE
jgi:hypothetical protein